MIYRCAILDDYQNIALKMADWGSLRSDVDVHVFDRPFADAAEVKHSLQGFHIVNAMRERTPFPREVIDALPDLKLLITTGMANKSIDLAACKGRVTVCGTQGVGNPTTGIAFGLMLELTRRIGFENARMKAGQPWQVTIGPDLEGLTLGIVGLGKLGKRVARIAQAFGMNVLAWSPNLTAEKAEAAGIAYASKEDLLRQADIVTIHMQLSERTIGLLGEADLALMKPSAYLVNTSRGPLVDEKALIDGLTQKRIGGAGLDVFNVEPLPLEHPFRTLENVVMTPHLGYVTQQNYKKNYGDVVENIRAFVNGTPVRVLT
ncbi:MAG TPA: D-2-hydroxyacid dehydrogenase family protein [Pseudolabrys sp.]